MTSKLSKKIREKKKRYAEGGSVSSGTQRYYNEKGIHREHSQGRSVAGLNSDTKEDSHQTRVSKKAAVKEHNRVLNEMRTMPKPKLQGLAKGGVVEQDEYIKKLLKKYKGAKWKPLPKCP